MLELGIFFVLPKKLAGLISGKILELFLGPYNVAKKHIQKSPRGVGGFTVLAKLIGAGTVVEGVELL